MIETVRQLNQFVIFHGVKSPELIVPALIEKQELISAKIAKLVLKKWSVK